MLAHWNYLVKVLLFIFIASAVFLFLPGKIFAALDITAVSPLNIVSPDEIIKVTATVSGLQSNPQYLQLGLTLSDATTNLFGITKSNGNEWYFYESSPVVSDLTSVFYSFTHVGGSWFGEIIGKFDINDSGYRGPGLYKLRLYKYTISSSQKVSSSYVEFASTLTVNIPLPTSTPTPTDESDPANTPTPIPNPTSTSTPTKKPTPTLTPTPIPTEGEVLGEEISSSSSVLTTKDENPITGENTENNTNFNSLFPKILIGLGLLLIVGSLGTLLFSKIKKV
jgi:hypothetical protein